MKLHAEQLSARNTRLILNRLGLRRRRKVFAIGFNKSGTTSLHALFETLGLVSHHGTRWRESADMTLLRSYDCFSDDVPTDLPKLDQLFPGSRFILQVRELDTWVYSRLAHIERGKQNAAYKTHALWNTTETSVKSWITYRNTYHCFVLSYFARRPQDLLVVNFVRDPDAAVKICRFLDYDTVPVKPARNVNPDGSYPSKHRALLQRCLADLGVPATELRHDILCSSLLPAEAAGYPVDTSVLKVRSNELQPQFSAQNGLPVFSN